MWLIKLLTKSRPTSLTVHMMNIPGSLPDFYTRQEKLGSQSLVDLNRNSARTCWCYHTCLFASLTEPVRTHISGLNIRHPRLPMRQSQPSDSWCHISVYIIMHAVIYISTADLYYTLLCTHNYFYYDLKLYLFRQ